MSKKSFLENVIDKYNWYNEFSEELGYGKIAKIRIEDEADEYEEYDSIEEFCQEWANADIDYYDYDFYNSYEDNINGPEEDNDFILLVKLWFCLF